jgi:gas vesicle protein
MNDSSKVLIGLLAGLAAGAALGLLFAPEAGSETRERLGQSFKDLSDTLKEKAAEELDNLSSLKEKVVDTVKGKMNKDDEYADELDIA